ncbi:hypothetical protein [uncultured Ruminococcus sp.]|uniref:hypothetical protein n=1 Tax=uncultured Ruminococcus sp. TaxID=165186 RepID=UPI0025D60D86|nr:hypothetical protein [uncultured Ruminococcus sp.]
MSKIKVADFYYGSVLSMLFSHNIKPALIENGKERQIYHFTTNNSQFTLFVKYRSEKNETKKAEYSSWNFSLQNDLQDLSKYLDENINLILALVCGSKDLGESELAILNSDEIARLFFLNKKSITISRKKNEKAFRIPLDGCRDGAITIKCNRFDELF